MTNKDEGQPIGHIAIVSYRMAKELWWEKYESDPSMDDLQFLLLVRACTSALSGSGTVDSFQNWHKAYSKSKQSVPI